MRATSFGLPMAAALLLLLVLHSALFCNVADAGAPECDCYNGAVEEATPRCLCACSGEYLQPSCAYKATDDVDIELWMDLHPSRFLSVELGDDISKYVGIPRLKVDYRKAEDNNFNKTNAYFRIPGERVRLLQQDVREHVYWTTVYKIESMFIVLPNIAPPSAFTRRYVIYVTSDGKFTITVEMIGWLLGSAGVVLFGLFVECCFLTNTEDDTTVMMEGGTWDPVHGPMKPGMTPRFTKNPLSPEEEEEEQNKAALKIQCAQRKRQAKKIAEIKRRQKAEAEAMTTV